MVAAGSRWCEARLVEADFRSGLDQLTDLGGADLSFALLNGANLHGANLEGCDLRDTQLNGARLGGAKQAEALLPPEITP